MFSGYLCNTLSFKKADVGTTQQPANVVKGKPNCGIVKLEEGGTSGLLIDAIETPGMLEARNSNQTAFALLKSIDGIPSLVKIFDLEDNKQVPPFVIILGLKCLFFNNYFK